MKIIKRGDIRRTYIKTCYNCGCEFEYEANEVNPSGFIDCPQCGYEILHISIIPKISDINTDISGDKIYNPCEHCPNNPKNNPNASGVCHCILGAPKVIC